mmetsp:Transcript_27753/g.58948  ORF Transcript_27753/g.58948 Transcript_27753/m.58948 type:complete len:285 (-) Transcript_27753:129-983(-)
MAYTDVCGKKLQAKMGAVLNESATSHSPALLSSQQSFAKRQLEKMGWTEGTGLGKRRDGMKDHVKIKQREDEMGLGREKEMAKEIGNVWWKDSVGGTLARLQQQKKAKRSDRKDKKSKKKSRRKSEKDAAAAVVVKTYTDEELFEATGGARFGMRAQRRAEGKWKRTESGSELARLEEEARASMEWNGRGGAEVVIEGEGGKKRKRANGGEVNAVSPSASEEDERVEEERRSEKRRRASEKSKPRRTSLPSDAGDEAGAPGNGETKEKKKKRVKKEKKSKKSKR